MKIGIVGCGTISGHHLRAIHIFDSLAALLARKPDVVHVPKVSSHREPGPLPRARRGWHRPLDAG
jgi:hypothetical protein